MMGVFNENASYNNMETLQIHNSEHAGCFYLQHDLLILSGLLGTKAFT